MYPDDCVQSIIRPRDWWVANEKRVLCRGGLVFTFVPHVDQTPYSFEPVGRAQSDQHGTAVVRVAPLRVGEALKQTNLPVAAMPLHGGEVWAAYRAKRRPCLVLGSIGPAVERSLVRGMPNRSTAPTVLVAPYYGADQDGTRAGYKPAFVERIRHCEYPQFVWDRLPLKGPSESILRLDQLQPMGLHGTSFDVCAHRLSDDALEVMDDILRWVVWGGVSEDSLIALYRSAIEDTFKK